MAVAYYVPITISTRACLVLAWIVPMPLFLCQFRNE